MNSKPQFFSMAAARQPINSTLVGIFLASWCLWTLIYYVTQSVEAVEVIQQKQEEMARQ